MTSYARVYFYGNNANFLQSGIIKLFKLPGPSYIEE